MYPQQIELFLMQFECMLLDQNLQRMEFLKDTLEDLLYYGLCPWSDDDASSGPDTCQCHMLPALKEEALSLMIKYYKYCSQTINRTN